jgi:hypothetical protein
MDILRFEEGKLVDESGEPFEPKEGERVIAITAYEAALMLQGIGAGLAAARDREYRESDRPSHGSTEKVEHYKVTQRDFRALQADFIEKLPVHRVYESPRYDFGK